MALPTADKTWQYNVNQAMPATGVALTEARTMLKAIVTSMLGFGTLPWTCRYSCSSTVAGAAGDGVNRWSAITDLVWANAGSAHSWIVLRQTGVGTTFEILISLENAQASGAVVTIYMSPSAAFTGGTTTARPTATDEVSIAANIGWGTVSGSASYRLHCMQSTDGQSTIIIIQTSNVTTAFWMFAKPKTPVTGWSNPCVGLMHAVPNTSASAASVAGLFTGATFCAARGVSSMALYLSGEAFGGSAPQLATAQLVSANDLSSEYPLMPVGLVSITASNRGRHGVVFDLWWGLASNGEGDTYPNDATRTFAQIGDLVVKWDGSTMLTA
jgi:hypothetical protein